ncbi:CDP-alcohol phosphatidyltransferase family protein [Peribacillus frigoritolerans]|uniref:CDP-alcohol phosphatidyltransferase family protein n=1 Tax=Peribacillus frigoritolerans TaxID=450367 RepID=UPI002E24CB37|nr:CDP-alcohol phosphatidyltransferase family protein [Peribacillus frigoritolerans]MED4632823.1 CDP-alcohol phosphatidyltransferase family protein [Peribacillus frigoritolerans]
MLAGLKGKSNIRIRKYIIDKGRAAVKKQIPNLFTFGNLFCGFLSVGYIMNGDAKNATILIFIAIMLDALDSRVARILAVSNEFWNN